MNKIARKIINYDITYKAFHGAWMTLTGTYPGRNKDAAIELFKRLTPNGEIIAIYKLDKYNRAIKLKVP